MSIFTDIADQLTSSTSPSVVPFVPTIAPAQPSTGPDVPKPPVKKPTAADTNTQAQQGGYSALPNIGALSTDEAISDYQKALGAITPSSYYDIARNLVGGFDEPRPEMQNYLPNEGLSKGQGLGLLFGSLLSGYPGSYGAGFQQSRNEYLNRQSQGRNAYETALRDWYSAQRGQRQSVGQLAGQMMTDARQSAAEIFRYKAQTAQQALIQQRNEETAFANVARAEYEANQIAVRLFSINTTHEDRLAQQQLQKINIDSEAAYRTAMADSRNRQTAAYAEHMSTYVSLERQRLAIMQQQADTAAKNATLKGPAEAGRALAAINQIVVQLQFERAALTGDPNNPAYIAKAKMLDDEIAKLQDTSQKLAVQVSAPEQPSPTPSQTSPGSSIPLPPGYSWSTGDPQGRQIATDGKGNYFWLKNGQFVPLDPNTGQPK